MDLPGQEPSPSAKWRAMTRIRPHERWVGTSKAAAPAGVRRAPPLAICGCVALLGGFAAGLGGCGDGAGTASAGDTGELQPGQMEVQNGGGSRAGSSPPGALDPAPTGGASSSGAAGEMDPAQGSAAAPGASGTGAGDMTTSPGMVPAPTLMDGLPVCARFPARSDGLLLDFDTYDPIDGSWGESALGQLTGGTSAYSCADDGVTCPATAALARVRTGGGGLRLQAAVPAQGYTGMVLWFGPCVDASAFAGVEFELSGELFGAVLSFKLQTHENYPIDLANVKGGCEFTSEALKWSECVPPAHQISSTTGEPTLVSLAWSDFASGLPNAGVAPEGLVGVELQFECPTEVDCAMDLRLGALRFVQP